MKRTKKLFSLALAFIMVMALMTPAFATQQGELTGGSITINDAVVGQRLPALVTRHIDRNLLLRQGRENRADIRRIRRYAVELATRQLRRGKR